MIYRYNSAGIYILYYILTLTFSILKYFPYTGCSLRGTKICSFSNNRTEKSGFSSSVGSSPSCSIFVFTAEWGGMYSDGIIALVIYGVVI
jgi:hypothetical protein